MAKGRDNWFELLGITAQIRSYQNGYVVTRSDMPGRCYMKRNGKPFPNREAAKDFLDHLHSEIYFKHLDELKYRALQPPTIHVTNDVFNKLNSKKINYYG